MFYAIPYLATASNTSCWVNKCCLLPSPHLTKAGKASRESKYELCKLGLKPSSPERGLTTSAEREKEKVISSRHDATVQ